MSESSSEKRSDYLTAKQLADILQVSETTIHRLRRSGRIPSMRVTERLVRYNLRDVRRALLKAPIHDEGDALSEAAVDDRQLGFGDVFEAFEAPE